MQKSKYGNVDPDLSKIKILNLSIKNEKILLIGFQIALDHYQMMIFGKDIGKLPKNGYLGPQTLTCLVITTWAHVNNSPL